MIENPKRERTRSGALRAWEDMRARDAAIQQLRVKHDPAYRRRYGRYLRGEITMDDALGGETHEAWYTRVTER